MWMTRNGEKVNAHQFGMGTGSVPGQRQEWDREGCYYITTLDSGQKVRLSPGDWVCVGPEGTVIDVQSNGKFISQHVNDPTVKEPERVAAPSPVIAMTTADLELEREKLIKDSIIERPHEPPVLMGQPEKRGPGRPKGAKNKPKVVEPLEEL